MRLSELLDPEDLIREQRGEGAFPASASGGGGGRRLIVQSPSGNHLDAEAFARRPDRPLTVAERQQRIREETVRKQGEARRQELRRVTAKKEKGCCGVM